MSSQPIFSVVIPTYRRPHYLHDAIYSVLHQDFKDLECIVSDNWNGQDTQEVIDQFPSDPRLRVVRPEKELNMPDHWEFATKHAEGKWVLVLADRKVLTQGALRSIITELKSYPQVRVGSFGTRVFKDLDGKMGWNPKPFKTRLYSSPGLINNFVHVNIFTGDTLDPVFPKTLNGFYLNAFAEQVRGITGSYFNNKDTISPDFTSFLINCAWLEEVLHIGKPLILAQGEHESHGRNFSSGKYQYYMTSLAGSSPYSRIPLRTPFLTAFLMQDFLVIRSLFKGNLQYIEPDWENFFLTAQHELDRKLRSDYLTDEDKESFSSDLDRAIDESSFGYDPAEIRRKLSMKNPRPKGSRMTPGQRIVGYLQYRLSHLRVANAIVRHRFANARIAAGF